MKTIDFINNCKNSKLYSTEFIDKIEKFLKDKVYINIDDACNAIFSSLHDLLPKPFRAKSPLLAVGYVLKGKIVGGR